MGIHAVEGGFLENAAGRVECECVPAFVAALASVAGGGSGKAFALAEMEAQGAAEEEGFDGWAGPVGLDLEDDLQRGDTKVAEDLTVGGVENWNGDHVIL